MTNEQIQSAAAQTLLHAAGLYQKSIDGDWGPYSRTAAGDWLYHNAALIRERMDPARRKLLTAPVSTEVLKALAAQIHLTDAGHYHGKIDAIWGPLSRTAAHRWHTATTAPASDLPGTVLTPYDVAKQHIGVKEIPGKKHNPLILRWLRSLASWVQTDETAWCSAFVAHCAREAGYEHEGSTLAARSWLNVGEHVPGLQARAGDVVIFWRGKPDSWTGHVAFVSWVDRGAGFVKCIGGNQSNSVSIQNYGLSTVLGFRRLRSLDSLQGGSNKI